jgi:hypothetical protein
MARTYNRHKKQEAQRGLARHLGGSRLLHDVGCVNPQLLKVLLALLQDLVGQPGHLGEGSQRVTSDADDDDCANCLHRAIAESRVLKEQVWWQRAASFASAYLY